MSKLQLFRLRARFHVLGHRSGEDHELVRIEI
jgi:hypothetical protein